MSYENYKLVHLMSLIILTGCFGITFFSENRVAKITGMIFSFILLVGGMGLLARLYPGEPWPMWAKAKLGIWGLISIGGPILAKRMPSKRRITFIGVVLLLLIAVYMAVIKPF